MCNYAGQPPRDGLPAFTYPWGRPLLDPPPSEAGEGGRGKGGPRDK